MQGNPRVNLYIVFHFLMAQSCCATKHAILMAKWKFFCFLLVTRWFSSSPCSWFLSFSFFSSLFIISKRIIHGTERKSCYFEDICWCFNEGRSWRIEEGLKNLFNRKVLFHKILIINLWQRDKIISMIHNWKKLEFEWICWFAEIFEPLIFEEVLA